MKQEDHNYLILLEGANFFYLANERLSTMRDLILGFRSPPQKFIN